GPRRRLAQLRSADREHLGRDSGVGARRARLRACESASMFHPITLHIINALAHRSAPQTHADPHGGVDLSRSLRFNNAHHALDTVIEGGGVLLAYDVLAYDDLRTGRLVAPVKFSLSSGRAYYLVCRTCEREGLQALDQTRDRRDGLEQRYRPVRQAQVCQCQ